MDGNEYIGEWKNNAFEGKGVFNYSNGDYYEGSWKDNKFEGKDFKQMALQRDKAIVSILKAIKGLK